MLVIEIESVVAENVEFDYQDIWTLAAHFGVFGQKDVMPESKGKENVESSLELMFLIEILIGRSLTGK